MHLRQVILTSSIIDTDATSVCVFPKNLVPEAKINTLCCFGSIFRTRAIIMAATVLQTP